MGLLSWVNRAIRGRVHPSVSVSSDAALGWMFDGEDVSASARKINEFSALTLSAVWACVNCISTDVATIPCVMYRRADRGKSRALNHPVYPLLLRRPNEYMTAFAFRSLALVHALNWGNFYAEIETRRDGQPIALHPLAPWRMTPTFKKGVLRYEYRGTDGEVKYDKSEIFHIHGLSYNGIAGVNVIRAARESLGGSLAAERFGARFFDQSCRPGGLLKYPGQLQEDAMNRLRTSWEAAYSGVQHAGKVAILEDGLEFTALSIPPEEAQFLQSRQFSVIDICRWYRVPPHKIADLTRATFSNIEHQAIEYVQSTLLPWMVRIEQEASRKLLREEEQDELYFEHLMEAALRADIRTRYQAYETGRRIGVLSANDVARMENRDLVPDGDDYHIPSNWTTPARVRKPGKASARERARAFADAFADVLAEVFRDLARVEADKLTRAARQTRSAEWAEEFFCQHTEHVVGALFPAIDGAFRLAGAPPGSARSLVDQLAARHCRAAREAVVAAGDAGAEALASEWRGNTAALSATAAVESLAEALATVMESQHA